MKQELLDELLSICRLLAHTTDIGEGVRLVEKLKQFMMMNNL
jgi:hypothetical protein